MPRLRTYRYHVTLFGGGDAYARIKTINRAQSEALLAQEFPDRVTFYSIKRLPLNQEWSVDM